MKDLIDVFNHFNQLIDQDEKMRIERIKETSKPVDPDKARRKLSKALPEMKSKPQSI